WRVGRRIGSSDGILAQLAAENWDGFCDRAAPRPASRQPAFQFARQSYGDASERGYPNDDAKTERGLRPAAEQMRHRQKWRADIGSTRGTVEHCDRSFF